MKDGNKLLEDFVARVRGGEAFQYRERKEDLRLLAFGRAKAAENLTHHDLANDFFAGWRLWKGYLKALEDVSIVRSKNADATKSIKQLLEHASQVVFEWQDELERKIRRPYFREFCLSRERVAVASYPEVESAQNVVRLHAQQGLPSDSRILFVDDEFDKGMADVLLQILFGRVNGGRLEFTTKGPMNDEWVYSEPAARKTRECQEGDRWARMVCVKDIYTAALWLKYWGEVDLFEPRRRKSPKLASYRTEESWADDWAEFFGQERKAIRDIKDILGYQTIGNLNLDKDIARPKGVSTFLFLDLRLVVNSAGAEDDSSLERDSKLFLNALKSQRPDIPVLMLTASRQTNKYTEFMGSGQGEAEPLKADGWLIKEAPDAMTGDTNSSRSAYYLLDFMYLSAQMNKWYRPSISWDQEVKQAYHEMWSSPYFDECLNNVCNRADAYLKNLKDDKFREYNRGRKLLGSVQQDGENFKFDIEGRLVARRVAVWALLYTADWSGEYPSWKVADFLSQLSCMPVSIKIEYPSNVLNFKTDLLLGTYTHKLLEKLLKEEYDWLEKQEWPAKIREATLNFLKKVRAKEKV